MLVVLGGTSLIALFILSLRGHEPAYQGRPLTQWLMQGWNGNAATPFNAETTAALGHLRSNAVPFLLQWVADDAPGHGLNSSLKSLVNKLPAGVVPNSLLHWADAGFHAQRATVAALAFSVLGDDAQAAVPELTRLMTSARATNASQRAVVALMGIGEAGVPPLLTHLADTNAPNRRQVAMALGWFPSLNPDSTYKTALVPVVIACLRDPDPAIRSLAVMSLGRPTIVDHAQGFLIAPALTNALGPDSPLSTRLTAIVELGAFGSAATGAVPRLTLLMADSDVRIRMHATNAILKIAPEALANAPVR